MTPIFACDPAPIPHPPGYWQSVRGITRTEAHSVPDAGSTLVLLFTCAFCLLVIRQPLSRFMKKFYAVAIVLFVLLAAVDVFAAEPRPKVPDAATLAAKTSQIAAWYRYAVDLEAQVATLKAQPAPVQYAPAIASVIDGNAAGPVVRWVDNSTDETGFKIERSADAGTTWATAGTTPANVTVWQDGPLALGIYLYRVRAFNATETSEPSNTASITE